MYNKKAFTLVELIVVITILSVLATVAFISFQWYASSSRDSVRLADMKSMEKVNTIFKETKGKYPLPNNATNIVYSWATAWTQWVFWKNSYSDTISMWSVPTDPLTFLPYPYSITTSWQEYQIAVVLENLVSNKINTQTYAWDQIAEAHVKWDYNGQFLKVQTWSLDYLLWVPSILASDINSVDIIEIINAKRLVYKWYNNLPASYSWSIYNNNGWFAFTPNKLVLFEGDIDNLANNAVERLDFLDNLEENYLATEIASESEIAKILDIKSGSPSAADKYVADILNNTLKTNIDIVVITPTNTTSAVTTSLECYDSANIWTVWQSWWTWCEWLLIVENGTGTNWIHTAVNTWIIVNSITYWATDIFTGQVTDMESLFSGNTTFNEDIGYWDTSNVTTLKNTFALTGYFNQNLNLWDTSSVITMNSIFYNAGWFNWDISWWDTSNVTNMDWMFRWAQSFNQDISLWNIGSVNYMNSMFNWATNFNQNISWWRANFIIAMGWMFENATKFNQDLSWWCVQYIWSKPSYFDNWAAAWIKTDRQPLWWTCP